MVTTTDLTVMMTVKPAAMVSWKLPQNRAKSTTVCAIKIRQCLLKELRHGLRILKSLALQLPVCNPCQSSPSLTILVPL